MALSPRGSLVPRLFSISNPTPSDAAYVAHASCYADEFFGPPSFVHIGPQDTLYGDQSEDSGSEVRFSVELTEISGLKLTYSLDIRRLKGPLRSYKYMYDSLRE